jgi:uncharacterized damage-inducible protein DinB
MNNLAVMHELFAYTAWADAIVWNAVLSHAGASTDGRVRDYLFHIHIVQDLFLKVWRGEPPVVPSNEAPELTSILESARRSHESLASFLGGLQDLSLNERVVLPWAEQVTELTGREPGVSTMGDTLLQVVNHSTYHRGQVNARLRELGGTPPMTDFIAWVWLGKPEAVWPAPNTRSAPQCESPS